MPHFQLAFACGAKKTFSIAIIHASTLLKPKGLESPSSRLQYFHNRLGAHKRNNRTGGKGKAHIRQINGIYLLLIPLFT